MNLKPFQEYEIKSREEIENDLYKFSPNDLNYFETGVQENFENDFLIDKKFARLAAAEKVYTSECIYYVM